MGRCIGRIGLVAGVVVTAWAWAAMGAERSRGADAAGGTASHVVRLTFLHVNDVHGQLEPRTENGKSVGGYARLLTAVEQVREAGEADRVFLIHAGDEFSRGDKLTTRSRGKANVQTMNRVGFDFWTPGNGEFYDGLPNLQARTGEAKAKVLASNLVVSATDRPLAENYVIERVGELRVAFFGLCFIHREHPASWALDWADPIETARALVPELRKQADLVVAINHIGYDQDRKLATSVPGIDLIIGAHSHTTLPRPVSVKDPEDRPVLICQAGDLLRYMGRVDLSVARRGDGRWRIVQSSAKLVRLDETVRLDPAITALIARLSEEQDEPKVGSDQTPALVPAR